MDPLSLTASIIAILELSGKVIQYLGDVKNAPKARASLAIEASNLYFLLVTLRYRLEEGQQSDEAWYAAVRSLGAQDGPLDQYKDKLEQLQHKLGGGSWIKDVGHSLLWKFSKEEVRGLLSSMESLKSLIQISLEMDHFKLSQAIKSSVDFYGTELSLQVNSLSQTFHDEKFMREQESINDLHRELHGWLSPCNPEILHSKACGNHHSGTNGWFLNGPLKWLAENKSDSTAILLLKGTSGTGKSTLLSQAIKQAKSSASQDSVLYFYCSFDDLATQNPANILASFIVQLSHQVPELLDDFMPEYLKAKERSTPAQLSIEKLEKVFITHAKSLPRVYLFLDAINECQDASATVDLLVRLSRRCRNLRMLITSTRDLNIREPSSTIQTLVVQMDSSRVTKDISIFVDDMLALDPSLRNITKELKADIGSTVISSADGMFRYARWLLNHLAGQRTGRAIRTALTEMPRSLNETYAMLLDRIPKSSPDREFLRRCLVWLSFAARPLKLEELAEAVILEHTDEDIDNDSRLHSPEFLLDISQGLFDLDINSGRVALAHSSVKTFLLSDWIQNTSVADFALNNGKGHSEIIRLCLTYLSFSEFKTGYGASIRAFDSRFEKYPLLDYIVKNWTVHAQTVDHDVWKCIAAFLDTRIYPNGGNFGWWLQCIRVVADTDIIRTTHSIYYPASYGFTNLVKAILDNDPSVDLEAPGGRAGSTALQVASYRKQREVCILLVEAGADAFSLDGTLTGTGLDGGFPSYFWAKANGWDDVCKLMEAKSLEQGSTITKRYGLYSMEFALSVQAADAEYRSELWSGEDPPT
ncbi:hypothetical protein V495_01084 [Pseudogymnoascus sp. VKM F-4514 (FW-929)]|nr:hypothetical protein V495_01084 [Pseudogymnoascus sp. VKM F-4514 (FW-929)]KFY56229.1 hypothetical protein V497_06444 [Pseudogymnoascus sp. VKM F-4516 (FW-969)]